MKRTLWFVVLALGILGVWLVNAWAWAPTSVASPAPSDCLVLAPRFPGDPSAQVKMVWGIPVGSTWDGKMYQRFATLSAVKVSVQGHHGSVWSIGTYTTTDWVTSTYSVDPVSAWSMDLFDISPASSISELLNPSFVRFRGYGDNSLPGPQLCLQRFSGGTEISVLNTTNVPIITLAADDGQVQWFGAVPGQSVQFSVGAKGNFAITNDSGTVLTGWWDWCKFDFDCTPRQQIFLPMIWR
jgi:hypothetical protein